MAFFQLLVIQVNFHRIYFLVARFHEFFFYVRNFREWYLKLFFFVWGEIVENMQN